MRWDSSPLTNLLGSNPNTPKNDAEVTKGLNNNIQYFRPLPFLLTTCFEAKPLREEIKKEETSWFATLNKPEKGFGEEESFRSVFKKILTSPWGFKILFLLFLVTRKSGYMSGYWLWNKNLFLELFIPWSGLTSLRPASTYKMLVVL